jgi:benzoyl-CoA 2,3-dioxygenase component A
VKREPGGLASNYLCDLEKGAEIDVTGPFGATFLMPNDPSANIIMICTGTGSAPFRAFTERRRRTSPNAAGQMHLYFGARRPEELPYFGPLKKVPDSLLHQELCYSRVQRTRRRSMFRTGCANALTASCRCWVTTIPTSTSAG